MDEERALASKGHILASDMQPNCLSTRLRKQTLALVVS
jgi:hypothetical protein